MAVEQPFYVKQALEEIEKEKLAKKLANDQQKAQVEADARAMKEAIGHMRQLAIDRIVGENLGF